MFLDLVLHNGLASSVGDYLSGWIHLYFFCHLDKRETIQILDINIYSKVLTWYTSESAYVKCFMYRLMFIKKVYTFFSALIFPIIHFQKRSEICFI